MIKSFVVLVLLLSACSSKKEKAAETKPEPARLVVFVLILGMVVQNGEPIIQG